MDSLAIPREDREEWPRLLVWLREFLKEELAPYAGRGTLVARMVISATLVMLITMVFRLPFGSQAIFAIVISRQTYWETARAVRLLILIFPLATGYVLVGTMFSLGDPMLRMLWVIVTLFISFFALSVIADYVSAIGFGIMVSIAIPLLDQHISTELKVERTLWAAGQTILAMLISVLVALFFAKLKPGELLVRSIATRLKALKICSIAMPPVIPWGKIQRNVLRARRCWAHPGCGAIYGDPATLHVTRSKWGSWSVWWGDWSISRPARRTLTFGFRMRIGIEFKNWVKTLPPFVASCWRGGFRD
jgi:hypothetical protein